MALNLKRRELFRSSIHIACSATIPLTITAGKPLVLILIMVVSTLYCVSEEFRARGRLLPVIGRITLKACRSEEDKSPILRPLYLAVGIAVSLTFFPEPVSYAAVAVLTLGDGGSSLIGSWIGRVKLPFNPNKTLEGSLAGLVLASAGTIPLVGLTPGLAAACLGMAVEALPLPVDDNLTVPLASAAFLLSLTWLSLI